MHSLGAKIRIERLARAQIATVIHSALRAQSEIAVFPPNVSNGTWLSVAHELFRQAQEAGVILMVPTPAHHVATHDLAMLAMSDPKAIEIIAHETDKPALALKNHGFRVVVRPEAWTRKVGFLWSMSHCKHGVVFDDKTTQDGAKLRGHLGEPYVMRGAYIDLNPTPPQPQKRITGPAPGQQSLF